MSKKKVVLSFVWSFLFLVLVTTFFCSAEASATTLTVGGSGSGADYICNLSSAQGGINQAMQRARDLGGATVALRGSTTYTITDTINIYRGPLITTSKSTLFTT